ncbi:MAG TPA: isoprenylcysteine carboxylmethyltransferase family protein [Candidatus Woesebacteria bacterium]|nr:isoprenylcysteine carboxylmethyltransferase family protein [Candidatus Woesebacteria bacterium]
MDNLDLFYLLTTGIFFIGLFWFLTDPRTTAEKTSYYVDFKRIIIYFAFLITLMAQYMLFRYFPSWKLPGGNLDLYFGLILFVVGGILAIWSRLVMNTLWGPSGQHNIKRQDTLITTGPFAFSRNPIYLGLIVMVTGYFLALQSYLILLVLLPLDYFWRAIVVEEALLQKYFGETYLQYKKKVRRWV